MVGDVWRSVRAQCSHHFGADCILILFFYYSASLLQFFGVKAILSSGKEGINKGYQWRVSVFIERGGGCRYS